jgi:membrane protease YdiL (CAAX protease family)
METSVTAPSASGYYTRIANPLHTILVLAAQGVLAFRTMMRVDQMRAAVNVDRVQIYERTMLFEWLMFALVILGVWLSGSPLAAVLGDRWRSFHEILRDAGIGVAFMIVSVMLGSIIGSHAQGAAPSRAVQFLFPHGGVEITLWILVSVTAGICEETIYRGYLQRQFMALTKNAPLGIILSAAVFGVSHAYQGFGHAIQIGLLGAMSGILAYWRKSVRPGMIAHAVQDILGGLLAGRMGH